MGPPLRWPRRRARRTSSSSVSTAAQVAPEVAWWYDPHYWHYQHDPETRAALDLIRSDYFSRNEPGIFGPIYDTLLTHGDHYMHLADLKSYLEADQHLDKVYGNADEWTRRAILNVSASGKVLQRSHHRGIRDPNLGGKTLSSAIKNPAPNISPLAGKPAPKEMLIDVAKLDREYFDRHPDSRVTRTRWSASGPAVIAALLFYGTFTEAHILAITQAICDYRRTQGTDGPLYMGKDTHALSDPAQRTALEVLAANDVETIIQRENGVTPPPVISRAILVYNRDRKEHLSDGIVITPSHNPPEDGGFKYNPTNGGPADTDVTRWVENRANERLGGNNAGVKRVPFAAAIKAATTHQEDFVLPYVRDLGNIVDMEAIRGAGLKLGVDPLGGAFEPYWEPLNATYGLDIKVVNTIIDPTFSFMTVDHDGVIRMDCSSPYAMARLVGLKDQYRVAFANDPDSDRHGDRHAIRGAHESEPLSGGRHRVFAGKPSSLAGARYGRKDSGKQ